MKKIPFFLVIIFFASCSNSDKNDPGNTNPDAALNSPPQSINYSILNVYPHDTSSFTEGLLVHAGQLYESTGGQAQENDFKSWFGPVDLKTGKPIKKIMLDTAYFGEGITILNGKIYQLTWKSEIGFVYDVKTYQKLKDFKYTGHGWSLTNDGTYLIMSDGTSNLKFLDPETLKVIKILGVQDNNGPVPNINELEFINGHIYANQWLTDYILKIDPSSGKIVGKADLASLGNEVKIKYPRAGEMNGIAYDSTNKKTYITGKNWPFLYEVKFD